LNKDMGCCAGGANDGGRQLPKKPLYNVKFEKRALEGKLS